MCVENQAYSRPPPKQPDALVPRILNALGELGPAGFDYKDQRWIP